MEIVPQQKAKIEIYNVKFKNLQNGRELSSIGKAIHCQNKKHMKTRTAKT